MTQLQYSRKMRFLVTSKLNWLLISCFCTILLLNLAPLCFAGTTINRIQTNNELVLGTPGDFPPFTVTAENGKLIGFDIDLAKNLANSMDVKLTIKRIPFSKLPVALLKGEVDLILSGISMTPKRNMSVAFIGPYAKSGKTFFGTNEVIDQVNHPLELNNSNYHIAVLKGSTSNTTTAMHLPKTKITYTETLDEAIFLLLNGKVDGLISDYPYCKLLEHRLKGREFSIIPTILTKEDLGIGITGDDFLFANLIQNYLSIIQSQGLIDQMEQYWFKNNDWIKNLPDLDFFKDM